MDSAALRAFAAGLRARARRSDVFVVAAALTCYASFGLIPLLAIGTRVAAACFGRHDVARTAEGLARYLHGPLGLGDRIVAFAHSAAATSWWTVLVALVPTSLYAEGMVRSLERFSTAPERKSRWVRGRVLTGVLVAMVVVGEIVLVGLLRPLLLDPFGDGLGARLLGILVAFNILFFALLAVLVVVYRWFASARPGARALLISGFWTASWLASQTLAYVIVVRAVSGFDHAFGGYRPAATVAAIGFLIYLEHLVFLVGYLATLQLHERRRSGSGRADEIGDDRARQRHERQAAAGVGRAADQEQSPRA
ncbi:MAG: YhjD/YihY/BrkB family envelope integrity protein [Jatrophihabitans sp.]|uniref:YhjD/YihY/BrkB family envelope integrity protein n=1 Tax=Jatrophihabitans sp. TaxID=1932789 RepID=UPI003F805669